MSRLVALNRQLLAVYTNALDGARGQDGTPCMRRDALAEHHALASRLAAEAAAARADDTVRRSAFDALALPMLVVHQDASVVTMNTAASALFESNAEVSAENGQLTLSDGPSHVALLAALQEAGPHRPSIVRVPCLGGGLVLRITAQRRTGASRPALFTVEIFDSTRRRVPSEAVLQSSFGLTRSQARTARMVASGLRPQEIADRLGVSHTTVRSHLKMVFLKTGAKSQAGLASMLLDFVSPVRSALTESSGR